MLNSSRSLRKLFRRSIITNRRRRIYPSRGQAAAGSSVQAARRWTVPLVVEVHGGAWCNGDRLNDAIINEPLAKSGVVVAALDFRMPPEGGYPASLADINYAIRWLKTRAVELGSKPDLVGALGVSSGGHQAMLLAMVLPCHDQYWQTEDAMAEGSPAA
jgi:acetyl esterase/lipase